MNMPTFNPESMPTIIARHESGLALILWANGDVDVLTIAAARDLVDQMQLALWAAEMRMV